MKIIATTLLFAAFTQIALSVAQTRRDPIVRPETTRKVSPHVYVIPDDDSVPMLPNVGIVVGTSGVLVIDPGMGTRNGQLVYAEVQKVAPGRQIYIVSTHVHPEHDLGASGFPASAKMVRSADEQKDIDEFGLEMAKRFAAMSAVNADLLKDAAFRPADIRFDKDYTLDLGGVSVHIIAMGPNHTRGDTASFVTPDRVLFAGDVAMSSQPAMRSPYSNVNQWIASLDLLTALHPAIVVPSHGPSGDAAFMTSWRAYFIQIRDRTVALKSQGRSADEAVKIITPEMPSRYHDPTLIETAIRTAYKEAP